MKRNYYIYLGLVLLSFSLLAGCRGPRGPMGPTGPEGPAGPGTQSTYLFQVQPSAASGTYTAICPAVTADNASGQYSTVTCYLHFEGYDDATLVPYTDTEPDATTTDYFCSLQEGKVILGWINSATTVPQDFDLVVTVVNP